MYKLQNSLDSRVVYSDIKHNLYRVAQKVSLYQESSLNRIKSGQPV